MPLQACILQHGQSIAELGFKSRSICIAFSMPWWKACLNTTPVVPPAVLSTIGDILTDDKPDDVEGKLSMKVKQ